MIMTSEVKKAMATALKEAFEKEDVDPVIKLQEKWNNSDCLDPEHRKIIMDQIFRDYLMKFLVGNMGNLDLSKYELLCDFSILCARQGISSPTLPVVLLADMFDVIPLDQCQDLFGAVELNVTTWKEDTFFMPCKNNILRICNDLLRRLSRTQNTVFCGRILLFLAKFFPFSERSGLNVISEFNLDNTTAFSAREDDDRNGHQDDDSMDTSTKEDIQIEEDSKNINIDYALYTKFWQLQDFFRNPTQCYEKIKWKTFSLYTKDVLNIFQCYKLDVISGKAKTTSHYFAKFLTNQNLFQLQLSDSSFRQYVLIQFLILFQYLKSSVKFKSDNQTLSEEQNRWILQETSRIYKLLAETPPNGKQFAESVKHILKREEQWNAWKNNGCPAFAFKKKEEDLPKKASSIRKRKRKLGDQIRDAEANKKFLMGNIHLTKLWNLFPDNMEACSSVERNFLPSLDEYFSESVEQLDPANQIEDEYKKVNDGAWGWRALRLLARKSPNFFTYGNKPIARLPDYLESMLKQMSKEDLNKKSDIKNGHSEDSGVVDADSQGSMIVEGDTES